MKNKLILLTGTIIVTIILFTISTIAQRKLIDYEPKISCLFVKEDILANEKLTKEMFSIEEVDVSLVASTKVIKNYSEIEGLYAKDNIYKGQLALQKQFDTKENLSIYEVENGKEKISIKIKNPESGVSYSIKNNSQINLYVTLKNEFATGFLNNNERVTIGSAEDGYTLIKLLENVTVLERFDNDGNKISESDSNIIDTILIAVSSEDSKTINLLKDIGAFNISEVKGVEG